MCDEPRPNAGAVAQVAPRPLGDADIEPIPLEPVDRVVLTTLVDNLTDALLLDQGPAKRHGLRAVSGRPRLAQSLLEEGGAYDGLMAEHGFSMLVTVERGDRRTRILFDAGMSPDGMTGNMRRLGVDPGDVEVVVLSHGHFDHTTGLDGFVRAVGRPNIPVVVHPGLWSRRRLNIPGADPFELPTLSRRALEGAGFDVVEREAPSLLFDGSVLITGEVARTTGFETGMPFHEAHHDHGWAPDPLILDDQALVVHVRGAGLVVLTGCGHAGIVNIARYAQRLTGVDRIHALVGGFHLNGPAYAPVRAPTVDALAALAPGVIVPAHCTGWDATVAIADRLPDAFIQNSVGTRYELAGA
ncbi:MAG TPA: MBL fold metallo-hydrolase [Acidimicrobiales bacterium]|nr:MBL fold metallo-hydrolase [Acidimicrobiales bacterium]